MKILLYHPDALGELHAAPRYYYDNDLIDVGDNLVAD